MIAAIFDGGAVFWSIARFARMVEFELSDSISDRERRERDIMKRHFKTKLVLNSQMIRRLQPAILEGVQGGLPKNDSVNVCPTDVCATALCSDACRHCS